MNPLKAGKGSRTYLIGAIMLLNMIYTLVTGDTGPTFDDPGATAGADSVLGGVIGAGLMTVRSAISEIQKRLDLMIPKP